MYVSSAGVRHSRLTLTGLGRDIEPTPQFCLMSSDWTTAQFLDAGEAELAAI